MPDRSVRLLQGSWGQIQLAVFEADEAGSSFTSAVSEGLLLQRSFVHWKGLRTHQYRSARKSRANRQFPPRSEPRAAKYRSLHRRANNPRSVAHRDELSYLIVFSFKSYRHASSLC